MKNSNTIRTKAKFNCRCLNTGMNSSGYHLDSLTSPGKFLITNNCSLSAADGFPFDDDVVVDKISAYLEVTDNSQPQNALKNGVVGQAITITCGDGTTSYYRRSCIYVNGIGKWTEWKSFFESGDIGDFSDSAGVVNSVLTLTEKLDAEKERSTQQDTLINAEISKLRTSLVGASPLRVSEFSMVSAPARGNGDNAVSAYFKGYRLDLTSYRSTYDTVYFRGAEWTTNVENRICRGIIMDDDGNIESAVPFIMSKSNGWQELPLSSKSNTLWATYCISETEGMEVWSPEYVEFRSTGGSSVIENVESLISRVSSLEQNDNDSSSLKSKLNEVEHTLKGVPPLAVTEFSMTEAPARANGDNTVSGYFKGYRLDLTPYRSTYDTVYFRGADWSGSAENRICRGIIMDDDGNIESAVPFIMSKSNGWQELPLSSKSNTLWATYCHIATGGEVWTPEYVEFRNATDGSVIGDIEELESRVAVIENAGGIELFLPNDIYLLNGKTTQLFFRGFIRAVNPYNYDIKVMCAVGKTFPRYYEIEATATGDYPFRIQVRDNKLNILADKEVTLHIVDFPTIANSLNVLCVGASATATGHWPAELKRMLNEKYTMNFVGRKLGSSDKSVSLEATGGWVWSTFISYGQKAIRFYINGLEGSIAAGDKLTFAGNTYTVLEINLTEGVGNIRCSGVNDYTAPVVPSVESGTLESAAGASLTVTSWEEEVFVPFYNADTQKVDFKTYADTHCSGQIDVLVVHLGVNSVLWEKSNAQNAVNTAKTFIDGFLTDFPGSKMIVSAIPLPDDGTNVYANTYSENNVNRYGTISSFMRYNHELYELVMSAEYSGKVFWAPANIFFDADYGYPKKDKAVNTRITSYTELVGTNGIHPVAQGSYMVADSMLPVFTQLL